MVLSLLNRYARWLHLRWPSGAVDALPQVETDFSTRIPGLYVIGELTGIPLLKHAVDSGSRVVRRLLPDCESCADDLVPLVIVGGGVSGLAAAVEAQRLGIRFEWFEAARMLETLENFPVGKPIFTDPPDRVVDATLALPPPSGLDREGLLAGLRKQAQDRGLQPTAATLEAVSRDGGVLQVQCTDGEVIRAHRVILAIGRSGEFRRLGVPGEDLDQVSSICHDPGAFQDQDVVVVGGGDSACEVAVALSGAGARAQLVHRHAELESASATQRRRVEQATVEAGLQVFPASKVQEITSDTVEILDGSNKPVSLSASAVFTLIGRKAPVDLLRRCGLGMRGDRGPGWWTSLAASMVFFFLLFHWKRTGVSIPIA